MDEEWGWARVKGVDCKIKGGVPTYGLTHCLHIVFSVPTRLWGGDTYLAKSMIVLRKSCSHPTHNLFSPFRTSSYLFVECEHDFWFLRVTVYAQ